MTNLELLEKVKNEGIKNLTDNELRRLANFNWKVEMFSLNGLCNYVQSKSNKYLTHLLEKHGLDVSVVTTKWITTNCNPEQLKKKTKVEKKINGKIESVLVPTEEKKQYFSLWFISGVIQSFAASIQAKAQSSNPKVKEKEKTELERQKEETKKAAAKVAANKRSNAAKKAAAEKKKNAAKKAA